MAASGRLASRAWPRRSSILALGESVRIALESLRANKLRTALTMLGIIIGVWSVVALLAIGQGARQAIISEVEGIGTNLLSVVPGQQRGRGPTAVDEPLTMDDVVALQRAVPEISAVAPIFQGSAKLVAGSLSRDIQVTATTPAYVAVRNLDVASGTFLTEAMYDSARAVVVLGDALADDIFGDASPIGANVRLNGKTFRVVGVLQPSGGLTNDDNAAFVPLTTAYRVLFGGRAAASASYQVSGILLQARDAQVIDFVQQRVEQVLRQRRQLAGDGSEDTFTVFSQATLLEAFGTVTTTLTVFLGAIAGISLLVGGIGVMNIMLVSVTERTKEIGLRKAVGAKRRDILLQFLIEALALSLLGGIIGLALGYLTAWLVGLVFGEYIVPIVTPGSALLALSFSAAVGLFFGLYPARRAARLNPIQALRYE
ncbi:ABC transporter permease [Kallotenue papyrolyticum]|uniref:ABC transporter permease n=1 Tax=Kallotenue papyrolyticum TaxID=1325125 RepID=UPI0004785DCA|nr:ABC transporter permease [Kallotenue papyrolyticum]